MTNILKGEGSRTNHMGWATLGVQASYRHFKHFFPVLQNLAHMLKSVKLSGCQVVKFDPWDMLNYFCFHVYAQMSLFIGENGNDFFWTSSSPSPVTLEFIELVPS